MDKVCDTYIETTPDKIKYFNEAIDHEIAFFDECLSHKE